MSSIPLHLTPRDALLERLARLNGQVMYAQAEAARCGLTGMEEDLHLIWIEVLRVESSYASMRYPRKPSQRRDPLRELPLR